MATKLYNMNEFHEMVRGMVKEAIREEMIQELERLKLKELGATPPPVPHGTNPTMGTKPTVTTNKTGQKPGDNVMVPGTNMNINQYLDAARKEQNLKKKKDMLGQISTILTTLNTLEEGKGDHLKQFQFKKKDAKSSDEKVETTKKEEEDLKEDKKGDRDDKVGPRDDRNDWGPHGKRRALKNDMKKSDKEMADAKKLTK